MIAADKTFVDDLTREFVTESREGLDRMERSLTELELRPHDRVLLDEIFRAVHTIKGATGFLGFSRLETLAHAGETLLSSLRTGKIAVTGELIGGLLELLDSLRDVLRLIEVTGGEGQRRSDEDFATIGRLIELNQTGLVSAALGQTIQVPELHRELETELSETVLCTPNVHATDVIERRVATQPSDKTIRVDVEALNRLINQVGELVLTRNQLLSLTAPDGRFSDIARRIDAITSELRETAMRLRLQPVGILFGKFPRLLRDLARACGKQVRLDVQGQETGLDKSLLEAIRDPLTHALRNAIDHGIETPRERLQAGKNAEGVISLRAFHQNGCVIVELTDDGAGICADKVAAKAVERGLVSPARIASMSEQERIDLVFAPGLSTAVEVTNVSGRGVGMDIVRADVEQAGGRVCLESIAGRGTMIRLTLPLTLAIVPALVLRAAGHSFAVSQNALLELIYEPSGDWAQRIETIGDRHFYRTRSGLVPVLRLALLLNLVGPETSQTNQHLALLEHDGCRFALLVDDIVAPEEIVVKPISAVLRRSGLFSGAAILGSGDLAMILDIAGLRTAAGLERQDGTEHPNHNPGLLVVPQPGEPVVVYEVLTQQSGDLSAETRFIPLSSVERIETLPPDQIERIAGRTVLRLGSEVVAVSDEGYFCPVSHTREVTAIICRRGARLHAQLASRVIGLSAEPRATACDGGRFALIDNRLAYFHEPLPFEPVLGVA